MYAWRSPGTDGLCYLSLVVTSRSRAAAHVFYKKIADAERGGAERCSAMRCDAVSRQERVLEQRDMSLSPPSSNCRRCQPSQPTDPHQPAFALGSPVGVGCWKLDGRRRGYSTVPQKEGREAPMWPRWPRNGDGRGEEQEKGQGRRGLRRTCGHSTTGT